MPYKLDEIAYIQADGSFLVFDEDGGETIINDFDNIETEDGKPYVFSPTYVRELSSGKILEVNTVYFDQWGTVDAYDPEIDDAITLYEAQYEVVDSPDAE